MGSQIGDPDEITVLVTGFGVCYCCMFYIPHVERHLLGHPARRHAVQHSTEIDST
jgi:hypothetical protein